MSDYKLSATLTVNDQMTSRLRAAQREAEKLAQGVKGFKDQDLSFKVRAEGLEKLKRLREMAQGMKFSPIRLTAQDEASSKLGRLKGEMQALSGKAHSVLINIKTRGGEQLSRLKNSLGELTSGLAMGAGATMLGVAGVGLGAANALKSYMSFEKQMSKVQAVANLNKDSAEMKLLTEQANRLGAQTEWTAAQIGEAQYYQAMAGWDTQKILAATPSIVHLASASGTDIGTASDILTDTMTGFGVRAGEKYIDAQGRQVEVSKHYADIMAKLVTSANTTMEQLGGALKYAAAPVGAMFNGKDIQTRMHAVEDAMVMTGLMANSGIKDSMAGTATRAVFSRFGAQNRNAQFALQALGVDFVDEQTGDVRRIRDVMKDLHSRFKEGVDPAQLLDFAEEMSETKLHADTRRKLESFIESTAKRGGKIGGADMLKLSGMLAGQEAMSGLLSVILNDWDELAQKIDAAHGSAEKMADIQLDNLAGDVVKLTSAWDAFQRGLFEGQAGEGLRNFTQALTSLISQATNLFKDGIQIGDIFSVAGSAIDQLKNKFLALDGVGSLLAGGALVAGLRKVISLAKSAREFLMLRAATQNMGVKGGLSNVATMTISAGVVNVNGKVGGKGNPAIIDNYNRTRERIRGAGTPPPTPSRFSGMKSAAGYSAIFGGIFGGLDLMGTRSANQASLADFDNELAEQRRYLQELKLDEAPIEQIQEQAALIRQAEADRAHLVAQHEQAEFKAGTQAVTSTLGAAAGAALGSMAGPLGTMIGGIIGALILEQVGGILADKRGEGIADNKRGEGIADNKSETAKEEPQDYFGFKGEKPASVADFRRADETAKPVSEFQNSVADFRRANETAIQVVKEREAAQREQSERFSKIDEKLGVFSPFKQDNAAAREYYAQKSANINQNEAAENFSFGLDFLKDLVFGGGKAHAAELNAEQLAQQAAMERGEFVQPTLEKPAQIEPSTLEKPEMELGLAEKLSAELEGVNEIFSEFGTSISEGLASAFEGATEIFSEFGTSISEGLASAFEGATEIFSEFGTSISEGLTSAFEGATEIFSEFGTSISEGLTSAFEGATELFSGLNETISSGLQMAQATAISSMAGIQAAFDSGLQAILSAWESLPGIFGGIFGGLGGAASAAGSAIAAGLTAPIGSVVSAWQSAAAQIQSIISSISAAGVGGVNIASNYLGTSNFEGGLTQINEHGGELAILPTGTKIYPHATTVDLLKREISARLRGVDELDTDLPAVNFDLPPVNNFSAEMPALPPAQIYNTNSTQSANTTHSNTINLGGVNISSGADFEEFIHRIQQLLTGAAANSARY